MNEALKQIRNFADISHGSQLRKYTPDKYIVHPVRVMTICSAYTSDQAILAAALLHDVLEDTPVTDKDIRDFLKTLFPDHEVAKTMALVVELTDVYIKDKYPQWNRRKRKHKEAVRLSQISADAQTIKYADIIDNAPEVTAQDPDFANTFITEYRALLKNMNKGNLELYHRAKDTIEMCLHRLKNVDR